MCVSLSRVRAGSYVQNTHLTIRGVWGSAGPLGSVVQSVSAGTLLRVYSQSYVPGVVGLTSASENQQFDNLGNEAVVRPRFCTPRDPLWAVHGLCMCALYRTAC